MRSNGGSVRDDSETARARLGKVAAADCSKVAIPTLNTKTPLRKGVDAGAISRRGDQPMLQKQTQPIDKIIGSNIRTHRLARKMSQTDLANELGVTFQQVQKYENGTNRIGSGRLHQAAQILGVQVSVLFDGGDRPGRAAMLDLIIKRDAIRFLQAYSKIPDVPTKRLLVQLVERASSSQ